MVAAKAEAFASAEAEARRFSPMAGGRLPLRLFRLRFTNFIEDEKFDPGANQALGMLPATEEANRVSLAADPFVEGARHAPVLCAQQQLLVNASGMTDLSMHYQPDEAARA